MQVYLLLGSLNSYLRSQSQEELEKLVHDLASLLVLLGAEELPEESELPILLTRASGAASPIMGLQPRLHMLMNRTTIDGVYVGVGYNIPSSTASSIQSSPSIYGRPRSDSNHGIRGRWSDAMLAPETPQGEGLAQRC